MPEILTQEEIDSLLSAVSKGEVPDAPAAGSANAPRRSQTVLPYDFRRPNRIAKEQIRTLQMLHDAYARSVSSSLSAYLRSLVDVQLSSVEQVTYGEFMGGVSSPSVLGIFEMTPLKGAAIIDLNPHLVFPMIDRILGGPGRATIQVRELTEIERALVERVFRKLLTDLQQAWTQMARLQVKLLNLETNPQFIQLTSANDIAILVSFDIRMGDGQGVMSLCFPFAMLEPLLPKLMTQRWFGTTPGVEGGQVSRELDSHVRSTPLEVRAVLEPIRIPINALTQLAPGDVLPLPWKDDMSVILEIGGRAQFVGRAGRKNRRRAVEITTVLMGEGERHA
jgi:flagellar motor switch protein FliM